MKGEQETKYDSVKLKVFDGDELIRTLVYKAEPGLNKVTWRLRKKNTDAYQSYRLPLLS